jgi:hypothetical protein
LNKQDISRLTFTVGKFAVTDFFDGNSYAHDPRRPRARVDLWHQTSRGILAHRNPMPPSISFARFPEQFGCEAIRIFKVHDYFVALER